VRVVSLVPSLTEAVAATVPEALVGCTDWCTHPGDLDARGVARVRGTKNPDLAAVLALRPDLVVANEEENRTVPQALAELERVLAACGSSRPRWLDDAETAWDAAEPVQDTRLTAVVPIWRKPWMALGRDTFAGDVLARLGVDHVLTGSPERYPRFDTGDLPPLDLVVLPDEPYAFTADDGPDAFPGAPAALVDGRSLTWYGPSMVEAPARLRTAIRAAVQGA
jgi:hypothetical protein